MLHLSNSTVELYHWMAPQTEVNILKQRSSDRGSPIRLLDSIYPIAALMTLIHLSLYFDISGGQIAGLDRISKSAHQILVASQLI